MRSSFAMENATENPLPTARGAIVISAADTRDFRCSPPFAASTASSAAAVLIASPSLVNDVLGQSAFSIP